MDEVFDEVLVDIEALPGAVPYLYVLYAEGTRWIKIGYTLSVPARVMQLQIGCPLPLRILLAIQRPDAEAIESLLKDHFAPYRLQGEWYTLPEDVPTVLDMVSFILKYGEAPLLYEKIDGRKYTQHDRRKERMPTIDKRILEALAEQPLTIRQLMVKAQINDDQYGFLRKQLMLLCQRGLIDRLKRGVYCSTDYEE
jgi:hypothetical protein